MGTQNTPLNESSSAPYSYFPEGHPDSHEESILSKRINILRRVS